MTDRPTLSRAVLDYATELERVAENPIAGRLRDLVREYADTEDPPPVLTTDVADGEPFPLPPIPRNDPLPRIEE
jgi:hypothetical protein